MWQKLQGLIIRNRRQEREWSQAALCTGICEVSISLELKRGKVEGSWKCWTSVPEAGNSTGGTIRIFAGRHLSGWKIAMTACFAGERLEEIAKMLKRREVEPGTAPLPGLVSPVLAAAGRARVSLEALFQPWIPGSATYICA